MVPNEDTISIRTLKYCSLSCAKLGSVRRTFWSIRVIFEIFIRVIKSFNRFNFSPIFCQNPSQKCSLFFFKINLEFSFVMTKMRLKLASEKSFKVVFMNIRKTYDAIEYLLISTAIDIVPLGSKTKSHCALCREMWYHVAKKGIALQNC